MKRLLPMLLTLALLAGCAPEVRRVEPASYPSAEELALAVLESCGRSADGLERTDQLLDRDSLRAYVANYYGLEDGGWTDCAIYRAGGAEAFEIAVLELSQDGDMEAALSGLRAYIAGREGDFTGYSPEQAAIVRQSDAEGAEIALADAETALRDPSLWARFAALFICEDAAAARTAFLRRLDGDILSSPAPSEPSESIAHSPSADPASPSQPALSSQEPTASPAPSPEPTAPSPTVTPALESTPPPAITPTPEPSPDPEPAPSPAGPVTYPGRTAYVQPGIDDMTIYDTAAIRAAWGLGNPTGLSDDDRAIYDRCREVLEETLTEGMSDYEKELALYTWLVNHAVYDQSHYDTLVQLGLVKMDPASYTPYGVLINGKGVCLSFATAFQLFMDLCGVECITVVGAAFSSREDHAWNMVRLDGTWYCADPTWDLHPSGTGRFRYFNVTSDYMAATDHQWDYGSVPEAVAAGNGR